MKKYSLIIAFLLSVTGVFSQTRTQKASEKFYVNNDVIVEINASYSDVTVEHWTKNEVLVESILTIDGVTVAEANEYFDGWKIEALGNKTKVVLTSRPVFHLGYGDFDMDFDIDIDSDFDFDFDFEPVLAYALNFDSVSFPSPPVMPIHLQKHLHEIEWDQKAYEKDKEKYLKEFEKQQQAWAEEIEKNFEPQMKAFEKEMEEWEKEFEEKYEPQMEAYEKEMEKWAENFEKNIEPQLKKHEAMMEEKGKVMEKKMEKMEKKMEAAEREMEAKHKKSLKMKKKILIKIPKNAKVKVNTDHGSITLPDDVNTIG